MKRGFLRIWIILENGKVLCVVEREIKRGFFLEWELTHTHTYALKFLTFQEIHYVKKKSET